MRIFTDNAAHYIQKLALTISKDPASMEHWRCLHMARYPESPWLISIAKLEGLKAAHPEVDCDIVLCSDHDVLLISETLQSSALYGLAEQLYAEHEPEAHNTVQFTCYDVFYEWRAVREVLLAKAEHEDVLPDEATTHPHDGNGAYLGEAETLRSVFADAKHRRKVRQPMHVLLVEDDPITRRAVSNLFKEKYALITASTAEEAVTQYLLHAPDIVFLDIGLPDASGFDVLKHILTSDPEAYVVMFSGNSYLDNVTSALLTGASGFVAKPFKKDKMLHYIEDSALHHHKYM